jgi:hypothetical protein
MYTYSEDHGSLYHPSDRDRRCFKRPLHVRQNTDVSLNLFNVTSRRIDVFQYSLRLVVSKTAPTHYDQVSRAKPCEVYG